MAIHACRGLIQNGSYPGRSLTGQVNPGHIRQGLRRTGLNAFWLAVAQKTFGGFGRLRIERNHLPRTGFQTRFAAGAPGRIDNTGVYGWFHDDGSIRAGIGTGDGVRALFAEVLDDQPGSPVSLAMLPGVEPRWTKIEISAHLYSRRRVGRFPVVIIGASEFASAAGDASRGVRDHQALSLLCDDQRGAHSAAHPEAAPGRYPGDGSSTKLEDTSS